MPDDDEALLGRLAMLAAVAFAIATMIACHLLLQRPAATLAAGVLALAMALVTLIDIRHYIIPDLLSLPAIPLGIIANIAVFHGDDPLAGLTESLLGAVLAGGSFYLLRALWFRLRKVEGLGLGDVKLAAAAGAWLGPGLLAPACLAAALAGLAAALVMTAVPGRRLKLMDQLPFGAFIAPVTLLFWLWRAAAFAGLA